MEIIPFRIKGSEEEENYSDVYSFLIKGNGKYPYEVEIDIDTFNDNGLTDERCTCPHYSYRQLECKHIKECKKILNDFDIETECKIKSAEVAEKVKVVILDDNELSMAKYAEEYPENFKEISSAVQSTSEDKE